MLSLHSYIPQVEEKIGILRATSGLSTLETELGNRKMHPVIVVRFQPRPACRERSRTHPERSALLSTVRTANG